MFSLFLTEGFTPFTLALALLLGLLVLELVLVLLGGTLMGAEGEADIDGPEIDIDTPDLADLGVEIDLDGLDLDPGDLELADLADVEADLPEGIAPASGGLASWLGFGKMPALIWLASVLMAFGITGSAIQMVALSLFGTPLPWLLPAIPAIVAAVAFARSFGAVFARLLPKTESSALSERHLGRRTGVITQGTASRGRPAEVRVTDRFGNTHYLRAEPLRDEAQIAKGTEVMVLRHRYDGGYLLVPLSD